MVINGLLSNILLLNILVIFITTVFIWFGSSWLEESAENLSRYYGLPEIVQGSIVVAIGSSFPELSSVVFTAIAGTFDMGVGAIVGSAIFNILMIPALSQISTEEKMDSNRAIVYKEAQFYMLAVSVLIITFALAVIYIPTQAGDLTGQITRPLAIIPLLLYGLYLFIQWQDVGDHKKQDYKFDKSLLKMWGKLVFSLLIILITVEQLVGSVESISHSLGIPEFLAGATIIAIATSLPDLLVSIKSAQSGKDVISLGNVLGSNTFDLLVAIPIGVLIVGKAPINFAVAVPMMGVLTLATVLLFAFLRTDLSLTRLESLTLLATYLIFVLWIIIESIGVTNLLPSTLV